MQTHTQTQTQTQTQLLRNQHCRILCWHNSEPAENQTHAFKHKQPIRCEDTWNIDTHRQQQNKCRLSGRLTDTYAGLKIEMKRYGQTCRLPHKTHKHTCRQSGGQTEKHADTHLGRHTMEEVSRDVHTHALHIQGNHLFLAGLHPAGQLWGADGFLSEL